MLIKTLHATRWFIETIIIPILFCLSLLLFVLGYYDSLKPLVLILIVLLLTPLLLGWKDRKVHKEWKEVYKKLQKGEVLKGFNITREVMLETSALVLDDKGKNIAIITSKDTVFYPFKSLVEVKTNIDVSKGAGLTSNEDSKEILIYLRFSEGNVVTNYELLFYKKSLMDSKGVSTRIGEALNWFYELETIVEQNKEGK